MTLRCADLGNREIERAAERVVQETIAPMGLWLPGKAGVPGDPATGDNATVGHPGAVRDSSEADAQQAAFPTRPHPLVSQNPNRTPMSNRWASMPALPYVRNLSPSRVVSALNLPWAVLKYR